MFGFIIYALTGGDNNYEAITLSLSSFNKGVEDGPRNPVVFNEPSDTFTCQPGECAYQVPTTVVNSTSEQYFFCGYQARVVGNCSVDNSSVFIEFIGGDLATPEPAQVSNIFESSLALNASRNDYIASQYGAVWFSHEVNSILNDGSLYGNTTVEECLSNPGNYTSEAVCQRFGGIGYTIQYNFTALHASPLFQGLADEALVRSSLGSDDFVATVTIDPLPITVKESGFAEAESLTALWMLMVVSFPFIGGAYAR